MSSKNDFEIIEGRISSSIDGKTHLYYQHQIPKSKKIKNIIHIIFQHGMIEYHARHVNFFSALKEHFGNRIVISCMDLVGHGLSGGDRAYIDKFETLESDYLCFIKKCYEDIHTRFNAKTFLIGHSLGGLITLKSQQKDKGIFPFEIYGNIFINSCFSPKLKIPFLKDQVVDGIQSIFSKAKLPLIYDAYQLTSDKEMAEKFIQDPLISKSVSVNLAMETLKACKNITSLSYFFETPSLFVLSGNDMVVDNEKAQLFITGMKKSLVDVAYFMDAKHDILNDTCRSDAYSAIIEYIEKRKVKK